MVYHNSLQSQDSVLLGANMNQKCHIWVSVFVVMNENVVKHFK